MLHTIRQTTDTFLEFDILTGELREKHWFVTISFDFQHRTAPL